VTGDFALLWPAAAALAGVALTLGGTALADARRFQSDRQRVQDERSLKAFVEMVQTLTELGRALRGAADKPEEAEMVGGADLVNSIDDLVGRIRRQAELSRVAGAQRATELIAEVEQEMIPLHGLAVRVADSRHGEILLPPGKRLLELRDGLAQEVRLSQWRNSSGSM
jgi:hypothetical protein